jgi:hypothetical protein
MLRKTEDIFVRHRIQLFGNAEHLDANQRPKKTLDKLTDRYYHYDQGVEPLYKKSRQLNKAMHSPDVPYLPGMGSTMSGDFCMAKDDRL